MDSLDDVVSRLESALGSPWGLLVILAVCIVDGFFPVVPSETLVISGGVLAAQDELPLTGVMAVALVGAITGDHISYFIGRTVGRPFVDRMCRRPRIAKLRDNAQAQLDKRGGPALIVLRFVPGGRTISTALCGILHFPLRKFTPYVCAGGVLWALQASLLGFFAGNLIHDNYLLAVTVGIVASVVLALGIEYVRHKLLARRRRTA
ncbi:DedA family protein [Sporichthya polymorpha]|uniref:DedA family protein n=1 Tax=Sporichthya polymorpha TaxID=35751 RepID=UPI000370D138|nr:DedA family protein [Sporichthya polymorpha]